MADKSEVTGKGHNAHSAAHSGGIEYNCRLRIQSGKGQIGLNAIPHSAPEDQPNSGSCLLHG